MSELFEVTTDYILKGIEPLPKDVTQPKKKPNASILLPEQLLTLLGSSLLQ